MIAYLCDGRVGLEAVGQGLTKSPSIFILINVAGHVNSDKVLFITNVDGLLMEDKLVEKLSLEEAKEIMPKIGFGMEKKILAATEALEMGVSEALIANGQRENPISSAIEHNKCTVISK